VKAPTIPPGALDDAAVLDLLEQVGGLRRGHFTLSSGRHSDTYLQCALLLQWPQAAEALGAQLAAPWRGRADVVVGPAMGGLLIGHEVARALGVRLLFTERSGGAMALRRSLELEAGERALVVEDVVTTAGSALEVAALLERSGAEVAGVAAIVDRGAGDGRPLAVHALARVQAPTWEPAACPRCAEGVELTSPGSRRLADGGRRTGDSGGAASG
jgi:orotate phosphoribosyltransferase